MKTIGCCGSCGIAAARVEWIFTFAAAAYNIVRMRRLLPASGLTRPLGASGSAADIGRRATADHE